MRVLYDVTTLAHIHSAEGVQGAGIFRATEAMGVALARRPDLEVHLSSAPSQYRRALRYLADTQRFPIEAFALPSLGRQEITGGTLGYRRSHEPAAESWTTEVEDYLARVYHPARIYNTGEFDIYHVNWRGETSLPLHAHPGVVLTVHDLIALKNPEWFVKEGEPNKIGDYLTNLLDSVRSRHLVMVSTESVKEDVLSLFPHISREQMHVAPWGVSNSFHRLSDESRVDEVRRKYGIPEGRRYLLCVNTLEPRKNLITAIDAYSNLVGTGGIDDLTLVLAGSKGWIYDEIVATSQSLVGGGVSVVITGYVEDIDLAPMYSGAAAFCYPSLDEGFGLPVLEAMRCGVPVITSNRPPLSEIVGDAALTVDPLDVEDLAGAMKTVLEDDALASRLRELGDLRSKRYTWDRTAAAVMAGYERAVEMRTASASFNIPLGLSTPAVAPGGDPTASKRLRHARAHSLSSLGGVYRGERCFIVGDGAGVREGPLALLRDEFTIACNGFYQVYDSISWKPTFYVVADDSISPVRQQELNGLTGSTFLFDTTVADGLRKGPDVIRFTREDTSSRVMGVDLFAGDELPPIQGAYAALASAIQIAFHMGFDPIYLVNPDVDPAWDAVVDDVDGDRDEVVHRKRTARSMDSQAAMTAWHRRCREALEASGRSIRNTSHDMLFDTYARQDIAEIFSSEELPEFERSQGAHVDETHVVASMFHTSGTMIDVGAHRGTSATPFARKGWRVVCFEPDPDNRSHLIGRLGQHDHVTIDVRAVGEHVAKDLPFYASPESSGVSGLSAFLDSHEPHGRVDMTTIEEIIDEYDIDHVDFLKIDVEGHDFSVLKGVPWDRMHPDVVECEYEDAKTLPLGHTFRDIAEYLRDRGYSVYVSEWHPIVRYGIRHDWRRVVPYPGIDVPSNSWGNLLAFKLDPGYKAVRDAFASMVTVDGRDQIGAARRPDSAVASGDMADAGRATSDVDTRAGGVSSERPFYADFGDRLRDLSPNLYQVLRLARRGAARVLRHRLALVLLLIVLSLLIVTGVVADDETWRFLSWAGAGFVLAGAGLITIGLYSFNMSRRVGDMSRRMQVVEKSQRDLVRRLEGLVGELDRRLGAVPSDLAGTLTYVRRELDRVREDQLRSAGTQAQLLSRLAETESRFADRLDSPID